MNRIIWGNTVESYLWTAAAIIFVLIVNRYISRAIAWLSCRLFKQRWTNFDFKNFTSLIIQPLGIFLVITVSIIGFYRLNYPPEWTGIHIYKYPLRQVLLTIAIIIQILSFTWLVMRVIDFLSGLLQKRAAINQQRNETQLIVFFRDFIKVVVVVIGLMVVLNQAFDYNISSLITGLSIVGAAIALALKESLENLIASFVIFFDKPFTMGDYVKVQNVAGTIERIGLRSTRLRTLDKSYVTVPNKQMVDSILDNVSLRSQIRGVINLYISLETAPGKLEQLLSEINSFMATIPEIETRNVLFSEIKVQAYILFIEFFTPPIDWNQFTAIKQKINFFILQRMEVLNITIAAEGKNVIVPPDQK